MKKKTRQLIGLTIISLTILAFTYYLTHHSYLIAQMRQTSLTTVAVMLLLYGFWFLALGLILQAELRICRKTYAAKDNFLLNAYSTLVNFFVPGQSGPIVRGAYLKKQKKLRVRDYIFVVGLYFASYAAVSALMLLAGSQPWQQTLLALLAMGSIGVFGVKLYAKRNKTSQRKFDLSLSSLAYLLLATLFQAIVQITIYAVELHSVNPAINWHQIITYTGAANFALFVALTPGAIGIRESFLLLSQHLHHISTANIIAASLIDRSVFLLFLAILFITALLFHAKGKWQFGEPIFKKTQTFAAKIKGSPVKVKG